MIIRSVATLPWKLPLTLHSVRAAMRDFGLASGLARAGSGYCKFVVLCRPRTGSNLLTLSLRLNPACIVFGELLSRHGGTRGYPHLVRQSVRRMGQRREAPAEFFDEFVFRPHAPAVRAVGFKAFYGQVDGRAGEYLARHHDIAVVHLRRRNVLRAHVSWKLAELNGSFVSFAPGRQTGDKTVFLDLRDCRRAFEETRAAETAAADRFRDHPCLDVVYEDLAKDFGATMNRVQSFLGVPIRPLRPVTRRQGQRRLSDAISNYAALKREFAGSPWADFFEE